MAPGPKDAMLYRPAVPADQERISALHVEVGQLAYAGILPSEYLSNVMPLEKAEVWRQRLDSGLDRRRLSVTVAELPAEMAGFSCFLFDQETEFGTYLHNLYVSPRHRRRGVASGLLVAEIERFATRRRRRPVHLLVYMENWHARSFYQRLGGEAVEEFERDRPGSPAVRLVRYQWRSALELRQAALAGRDWQSEGSHHVD